ncbi:MAG: hypothetical protein IKH04_13315 [Kiritimatiellae bacterium]|nr:hypothetical protein [Kiritimatiellia bacterium]
MTRAAANVARAMREVARTTATELSSQPVTMLLILSGILMTALIPLLHFHDFGEPGRLVRDGGLAYQLAIGTVVSVFAVSRSIHAELEDGTALAALAKPLPRPAFLAGKWLGVMSVAAKFWLATLAMTIVAARISPRFTDLGGEGVVYVADSTAQALALMVPAASLIAAGILDNRRRARFCLAGISLMLRLSLALLAVTLLFDRQWRFAPSFANADLAIATASVPILFAIAAISAIAAALSVRLPAAAVMTAAVGIVAAGLSWDALTAFSPLLEFVPVPNIQSFWLADELSRNGAIGPAYLALSFLHAAAISAFALAGGSAALRGRDL